MNTKVIGIGNSFRCDDSIGPLMIRQVQKVVPAFDGLNFVESDGEPARLLQLLEDCDTAIFVDAVQTGEPAGKIMRLEYLVDKFDIKGVRTSTHGGGLGEALRLAEALEKKMPRIIILGIEGKNFSFGEKLSDEVNANVNNLKQVLINEIKGVIHA